MKVNPVILLQVSFVKVPLWSFPSLLSKCQWILFADVDMSFAIHVEPPGKKRNLHVTAQFGTSGTSYTIIVEDELFS